MFALPCNVLEFVIFSTINKIVMKNSILKITIIAISIVTLVSFSTNFANAENVPNWIKNNALWYGQGEITETEFLNSIKFLIENDILVLDNDNEIKRNQLAQIIIPNGNYVVSGGAVYLPLNLEINPMTTVQWINDDVVQHTVQSQDKFGKIIGLFNSIPLNTGETFEFKFTEEGVYNYYCSLHPWRVGLVTVR